MASLSQGKPDVKKTLYQLITTSHAAVGPNKVSFSLIAVHVDRLSQSHVEILLYGSYDATKVS